MVTPAPGVRLLWRALRHGPRRKPKPSLNGDDQNYYEDLAVEFAQNIGGDRISI
jgi:hypothetical protein